MKKIFALLFTFILCFTQVSWGQTKLVDTSKTYTYEQMQEDLYELQEAYPELIKVSVIGESEYGRNIYEAKLGTGKAILHINASHHAREWISTILTMKMIEDLAIGYNNNEKWDKYDIKDILTKTTISFVPMVNPDGVTLQQSGLESFPESDHEQLIEMNGGSTNFKRWKANGKGIDLNRQYNANWNSKATPTEPSYAGFKGNKPEEAKEVVSLLNLVRSNNPEMVVSYHSSGELIFWKYGQDSATEKRDYAYAQKINSYTGYKLVNSGYGMEDGKGFKDWFVITTKRPGFTIELSPYVGETHVPLSNFSKIWSQNKYIPLYLAEESYKLYYNRNNPTPPKETEKPPVKVIAQKQTTTNLNMRSGPSTSSKTITTLKKGTKVDVLESKNGWDKIKYGSKTGYASNKYLKAVPKKPTTPTTPVKVIAKKQTTANLNMRSGPSTSSKTITTLKKGTKVDVLESKNGWDKIKYGSKTGYASNKYLKKVK